MIEMIILSKSLLNMWVIIGASWRGLSNEYSHVFLSAETAKIICKMC